MRQRAVVIPVLVLILGAVLYCVLRCRPGDSAPVMTLPPGVGAADLDTHNRGVARMGQFNYGAAVDIFDGLAAAHPDWLEVKVDLAIALLNRLRQDTKDLDRALEILGGVIEREAGHLRANHCSGLILLHRGHYKRAKPFFELVALADQRDAYSAYFAGDCCWNLDEYKPAVEWFSAALEREPALVNASYVAFRSLRALGRDEEAQASYATFEKLKHHVHALKAEIKYTRMGPHGIVRAIGAVRTNPRPRPDGPLFQPRAELLVTGAEGLRWRTGTAGPKAGLTACDLDQDGQVDLLLTGAFDGATPNLVLLRRGAGFEAQKDHPLSSAEAEGGGALWGDYDNDGLTDVHLGGLWRQVEVGRFENVSASALPTQQSPLVPRAFVDADHDGDLDLLGPGGMLVNKLDGTFGTVPEDAGLINKDRSMTGGLVLGDFDHDRDVDILILNADAPHEVLVNDRLWRWRQDERYSELCKNGGHRAGVCLDRNADGQVELYLASDRELQRWEPDESGVWVGHTLLSWAEDAQAPTGLGVLDADGDGKLDLLLTGPTSLRVIAAESGRLIWEDLAAGPLVDCRPVHWGPLLGEALIGVTPSGGLVIWRPGAGRHKFAALTFSGLHRKSASMRSNATGLGVRVAVRVGANWTVRHNYGSFSGAGQSLQPLAVGLAGHERIDFVDLLWSEGLLQTELDLAAGKLHHIEETQRQTSSCPVLFAWDGRKFAFVTDLLGVGGLGFWVEPDTYAPAVPREAVLLPAGLLKPRAGELILKLCEPMEETCYLDGAQLQVLDLPPGWKATVDERMVVEGPAATGRLVFYRREELPAVAADQHGVDVLDRLARADLKAAEPAELDRRFIGRTAEQVLTLSFETALTDGPGRPILVADGWVEYPYAQTMFAAWQADAAYEAPTVEALGADGVWKIVLRQFGYPAGMPRQMSVPLGKLPAGTKKLRIRTTQEIYWDRIAVAFAEPCPEAVLRELKLNTAELAFVGFPRRTTGSQRLPHYDYEQRAPLWDVRHQAGLYTRTGAVGPLVTATDDAVAVFGPGDEVELRFEAPAAGPQTGWSRRYILNCTGWCKDMDLFTLGGESVGPLPMRSSDGRSSRARDDLHANTLTRYRFGR